LGIAHHMVKKEKESTKHGLEVEIPIIRFK
jgi:hypothetical protein